jgi:hypothetical protein
VLECGKLERGVLKMVDTESLALQNHMLRKTDAAVDWERLYAMMEPLYSEDRVIPVVFQRYAQERISKSMPTGKHPARRRLRMRNLPLRRRKNGGTTPPGRSWPPPGKGEEPHWRLSRRLKPWRQILPARHSLSARRFLTMAPQPASA